MTEIDLLLFDADEVLKKVDLSSIEGRTILVTGASGLIGVHILYSLHLFIKRYNITCKVIGIVYNELPHSLIFLKKEGFTFMRGNLAERSFSARLPNADIIIHAATYGQPGAYLIDKIGTLILNTSLTIDLFKKLNKSGKFLFFSSSSVYIGLSHVPFNEEEIGISNTNHPRSCYIEAKRCGEAICEAYKSEGVDAKSVRLSLAYGPGNKPDDKRVIYDFMRKGICTGKIQLLDSGKARRTYCYISDAVSMILNILFVGKESIYNVGGNSDTTVAKLGAMIGAKLGVPTIIPDEISDSEISKSAPLDDKLDLARYHNEFGSVKYIGLDEGLDRTIQWQQNIFKRL